MSLSHARESKKHDVERYLSLFQILYNEENDRTEIDTIINRNNGLGLLQHIAIRIKKHYQEITTQERSDIQPLADSKDDKISRILTEIQKVPAKNEILYYLLNDVLSNEKNDYPESYIIRLIELGARTVSNQLLNYAIKKNYANLVERLVNEWKVSPEQTGWDFYESKDSDKISHRTWVTGRRLAEFEMTPLHVAINMGKSKIVEILLKAGANPTKKNVFNDDGEPCHVEATPLVIAAFKMFFKLSGGPRGNLWDVNFDEIIQQQAIINLLLNHGATITTAEKDMFDKFMFKNAMKRCEENDEEDAEENQKRSKLKKMLCASWAEITSRVKDETLEHKKELAPTQGSPFEQLLGKIYYLNKLAFPERIQNFPAEMIDLHETIGRKRDYHWAGYDIELADIQKNIPPALKDFEELLKANTTISPGFIDQQDPFNGNTLLHYAVLGNSVELVNLLLKYKPNLTLQNASGYTAINQCFFRLNGFKKITVLDIAIENKNLAMVKLLLSLGAQTENQKELDKLLQSEKTSDALRSGNDGTTESNPSLSSPTLAMSRTTAPLTTSDLADMKRNTEINLSSDNTAPSRESKKHKVEHYLSLFQTLHRDEKIERAEIDNRINEDNGLGLCEYMVASIKRKIKAQEQSKIQQLTDSKSEASTDIQDEKAKNQPQLLDDETSKILTEIQTVPAKNEILHYLLNDALSNEKNDYPESYIIRLIELGARTVSNQLLNYAIKKNYANLVERLVNEWKVSPEQTGWDFYESKDSIEISEALMVAAPKNLAKFEMSPLHVAINMGKSRIVEILLKAGANPTKKNVFNDDGEPCHVVATPLVIAASELFFTLSGGRNGNLSGVIFDEIIQQQAIITLLLNHGATITTAEKDMFDQFMFKNAMERCEENNEKDAEENQKRSKLKKMLCASWAEITSRVKDETLEHKKELAPTQGSPFEQLLGKIYYLNKLAFPERIKNFPVEVIDLHETIGLDQVYHFAGEDIELAEIQKNILPALKDFEELLKANTATSPGFIDQQDPFNGNTLLHYAVLGNSVELVNLLLKYKPNLTLQNALGYTAINQCFFRCNGFEKITVLDLAIENKNLAMVKLLLSLGAQTENQENQKELNELLPPEKTSDALRSENQDKDKKLENDGTAESNLSLSSTTLTMSRLTAPLTTSDLADKKWSVEAPLVSSSAATINKPTTSDLTDMKHNSADAKQSFASQNSAISTSKITEMLGQQLVNFINYNPDQNCEAMKAILESNSFFKDIDFDFAQSNWDEKVQSHLRQLGERDDEIAINIINEIATQFHSFFRNGDSLGSDMKQNDASTSQKNDQNHDEIESQLQAKLDELNSGSFDPHYGSSMMRQFNEAVFRRGMKPWPRSRL